MAERDYSFKRAKRTGKHEDWNNYRRLKTMVNNKVRSAEAVHYKGLINSASDPKKLWRSLSLAIGNNNHGSSVRYIEDDSKHLITEDKKIASKFNKYFASIGNKVAGKLRKVVMNAWEKNEDKKTERDPWDLCPVDHETISGFIRLLKTSKVAGLDKIQTRMIRDSVMELTPSITYLVNKSIMDGKFPMLRKLARVTPLHKADD